MAGQFAGARPKRGADGENATFALNRFDNNGADGIVEFGFKVGDIVKPHKLNAGHQWSKRLPIFRGMRYGKRAEGPAMKGILERQDASLALCAALMSGQPCQFDRALNSFRAAIGEKDPLQTRPFGKFARQRALVPVMKQIREVYGARGFATNDAAQPRVRISQRINGQATKEIEILTPAMIVKIAAAAPHKDHRGAPEGVHQIPSRQANGLFGGN